MDQLWHILRMDPEWRRRCEAYTEAEIEYGGAVARLTNVRTLTSNMEEIEQRLCDIMPLMLSRDAARREMEERSIEVLSLFNAAMRATMREDER